MTDLNNTFDVSNVENFSGDTDRNATLVISKTRNRPNLPVVTSMTEESLSLASNNSNGHLSDNGERTLTRERHHVRRGTVTVAENPIESEVAKLINDVLAKHSGDDFVEQLKHAVVEYSQDLERRVQTTSNSAKDALAVAMDQFKSAKNIGPTADPPSRLPTAVARRHPDQHTVIEQLTAERDYYQSQSCNILKTLSDLIAQQSQYMDTEKGYIEQLNAGREKVKEAQHMYNALKERYEDLRLEAEQRILEANSEIERLNKEHENSTVEIRFKNRQLEVQVKSLQARIDQLQAEKEELLSLCDDLIARSAAAASNQSMDPSEF